LGHLWCKSASNLWFFLQGIDGLGSNLGDMDFSFCLWFCYYFFLNNSIVCWYLFYF
jgi:hypothetical protein